MAVVDSAEREVVPELGVPLVCQLVFFAYMRPVDLRSHVRWSDGAGGRRRQVDQGWSRHIVVSIRSRPAESRSISDSPKRTRLRKKSKSID